MSGRKDRQEVPDKVALNAREVRFDWTGLTPAFIPREPFASHLLNVLHILLPEGERWFVKIFGEALPLIQDDELREDVIGFIGQEGMHAHAHQQVQDYFTAQGIDTRGYVRDIEYMFQRMLGDRKLTGKKHEEWLIERLALVAAIEHVTAFLGNWVLNAKGLDKVDADPRMIDLLRWHGAEEVEHRAVAYDVYVHVDGRYSRRIRTYAISSLVLTWLFVRGVRALMKADPATPPGVKARWRDLVRTKRMDVTPGYLDVLRWSLRYFRRDYHPGGEGSTQQAVAYLAQSPAALAADQLARDHGLAS
ncbi:metal-dependent hydrolase [Marmoricola sp. RAF53]|uniref:metal-dependent hydrolase n=1 Tax=Marmoricola sp. RAF53 TaxID=3233059 RepID=UPI003F96F6B1